MHKLLHHQGAEEGLDRGWKGKEGAQWEWVWVTAWARFSPEKPLHYNTQSWRWRGTQEGLGLSKWLTGGWGKGGRDRSSVEWGLTEKTLSGAEDTGKAMSYGRKASWTLWIIGYKQRNTVSLLWNSIGDIKIDVRRKKNEVWRRETHRQFQNLLCGVMRSNPENLLFSHLPAVCPGQLVATLWVSVL